MKSLIFLYSLTIVAVFIIIIAAATTTFVFGAEIQVIRSALYHYNNNNSFIIHELSTNNNNPPPASFAGASFACEIFTNFSRNVTGWDSITTTPSKTLLLNKGTDAELAYFSSGYLEAFYTWRDIIAHNYSSQGVLDTKTEAFVRENINKMRSFAANDNCLLAHSLRRFFKMLDGMVAGFNQAVKNNGESFVWTFYDLYILNIQAEAADYERAVNYNPNPAPTTTAAPTTSTAAAPTTTTTSTAAPTTTTTSTAAPTTTTTSTAAPTTTTTSTAAPTTTTSTAAPTTTTTSTAAPTTTTTSTAAPTTTTSTAAPTTTTSTAAPTTTSTTAAALEDRQAQAQAQQQQQQQDSSSHIFTQHEQRIIEEHEKRMKSRFNKKNSNNWIKSIPGLHCSALIKRTADDIIVSHATWSTYNCMLRQIKRYDLETSIYMSSYPGTISSIDDYYLTGNGLIVTETTNDIPDGALLHKYVTTKTVPACLRAMCANVWSSSGPSWSEYFLVKNSGTYNNQWMILDTKIIKNDNNGNVNNLHANTFYICEQAPGDLSRHKDMSYYLEAHSYWPSYNIPFFDSIREAVGYKTLEKRFGYDYSWTHCSRRQIFDRNQSSVTNFNTMHDMIGYNNWQFDPLSKIERYVNCDGCSPSGTPVFTISSRLDLLPTDAKFGNLTGSSRVPEKPLGFGAIDIKSGSYQKMKQVLGDSDSDSSSSTNTETTATSTNSAAMYAINGPSTSNGLLKPFSWSDLEQEGVTKYMRHVGQQNTFNYPFIETTSSLSNKESKPASWSVQPTSSGNAGSGNKGGKIAGGIIGALAGCGIIFAFVWYRKKNSRGTGFRASEIETGTYQTL